MTKLILTSVLVALSSDASVSFAQDVNVQVQSSSFFGAFGGTVNNYFTFTDGQSEFDTGSNRDENGNVVPGWGQTALVFNPFLNPFNDSRTLTVEVGQAFRIGTLFIANRTNLLGSAATGVSFQLTAAITDENGNSLAAPTIGDTRGIGIINTPNTSDPKASADIYTVSGFPLPAAVLEDASATFPIFMRVLPFSLSPAPDTFPAPTTRALAGQQYIAVMTRFGEPADSNGFLIPEPSTALFGVALASVPIFRRWRRRKSM